jgi:hypothetical protein
MLNLITLVFAGNFYSKTIKKINIVLLRKNIIFAPTSIRTLRKDTVSKILSHLWDML